MILTQYINGLPACLPSCRNGCNVVLLSLLSFLIQELCVAPAVQLHLFFLLVVYVSIFGLFFPLN